MLTAFARVRPEVELEKSQADLDIVAAQLVDGVQGRLSAHRASARSAVPLKEELTRNFTPTLWILLGTAGFVLLIVCASIANLLLARMVRREREISVRAALGATRARLLRQLLTESLMLAVTGGVLGLVLSAFSLKLLTTFTERFTARAHEISIDLNVLFFTLGVSVVTGLIFGSIPACRAASTWRRRCARAARTQPCEPADSQRADRRAGQRVVHAADRRRADAAQPDEGAERRSGFKTENLLTLRADMSFDKFPLTAAAAGSGGSGSRPTGPTSRTGCGRIPGVIDVGGGGTFPLNEHEPFPRGFEREFHPLPPGCAARRRSASGSRRPTTSRPRSADRRRARLRRVRYAGRAARRDRQPVGGEAASGPNEDPDRQADLAAARSGTWMTIVGVVADVRQQLDRSPARRGLRRRSGRSRSSGRRG